MHYFFALSYKNTIKYIEVCYYNRVEYRKVQLDILWKALKLWNNMKIKNFKRIISVREEMLW